MVVNITKVGTSIIRIPVRRAIVSAPDDFSKTTLDKESLQRWRVA